VSLERPWLLLALLVAAVAVVLYVLAERRRSRYAVTFTNLDVLAAVSAGDRSWRRHVPPALVLLSLAALCVGLTRPHVEREVGSERATIILVIDASRSMQSTDVRPSRLVAAKRSAKTFLDRVPERLQVGLVVFSGDVQVGAPATTDHELVRRSIDGIGDFAGFGGTAIGDAIARAVELGQEAVRTDVRRLSSTAPADDTRGLVSIVFLSDGRQNRGIIPPLQGAAIAKAAGIPVHTIALGTANPDANQGGGGFGGFGGGFGGRNRAPDPATLRAIARATGGKFYEAKNAGALESAYSELGGRLGREPGLVEITFLFLLGAAAVLVLAGVLSALWSPRLP
jgi:Ca-activated chloride channel family protein